MLNGNIQIFDNVTSLSFRIATDILSLANKSINEKKIFRIVLAGGNSFLSIYKLLNEFHSEWKYWHIYLGDERLLTKFNKHRNDNMIKKQFVRGLPIPKKNINFFRTDFGSKNVLRDYEIKISKVPIFDLVLLGMGEDGHTASLFPNRKKNFHLKLVNEHRSPKWPDRRISLNYSTLNNSLNVYKVVCGSSKRNTFLKLLKGKKFPISYINGKSEEWYVCSDCLIS